MLLETCSLLSAQRETAAEVSALQGVVSCKLDRSELRNLQGAVRAITDHAAFHATVESHMQNTDEHFRSLDSRTADQATQQANTAARLESVEQAVDQRATAQRFEELTQTVESIAEELTQRATLAQLKDVGTTAQTAKSGVDTTVHELQQLRDAIDRRMEELQKQVDERAIARETASMDDFGRLQRDLRQTAESVEQRAMQSDLDNVRKALGQYGTFSTDGTLRLSCVYQPCLLYQAVGFYVTHSYSSILID